MVKNLWHIAIPYYINSKIESKIIGKIFNSPVELLDVLRNNLSSSSLVDIACTTFGVFTMKPFGLATRNIDSKQYDGGDSSVDCYCRPTLSMIFNVRKEEEGAIGYGFDGMNHAWHTMLYSPYISENRILECFSYFDERVKPFSPSTRDKESKNYRFYTCKIVTENDVYNVLITVLIGPDNSYFVSNVNSSKSIDYRNEFYKDLRTYLIESQELETYLKSEYFARELQLLM